ATGPAKAFSTEHRCTGVEYVAGPLCVSVSRVVQGVANTGPCFGATTMDRRDFLKQTSGTIALGAMLPVPPEPSFPAPAIQTGTRVKPVVISDFSGFNYRNGGKENAVERAFRLITEGKDVLDALI